jgi:hypothetical protein
MIYEGALTEAFKEIIINELYDTGALYESMQIYSESINNEIVIDIQCEEYIVYHIQRLDLIPRLVEFPEFGDVLSKWIVVDIERFLEFELNNLDGPDPSPGSIIPRVRILLNGSDI